MVTSEQSELGRPLADFLGHDHLRMFVGGEWVTSAHADAFEAIDPGSGAILATVSKADPQDVDKAVAAAKHAFERAGWSNLPANERARHLVTLADLIVERQAILQQLESLDVGKPLSQSAWDVSHTADTLRFYADLAAATPESRILRVPDHDARLVRHPYGVCGFIVPWNFPLLLAGWGIAPALAAGNTVVIKPAQDASLSVLYLAKLAEEAGIPPGVINVVTGPGSTTGRALAEHPALARMSFTGSPETGRGVAAACGQNLVPVKLELGGKGAAVVFDDGPLESTVDALCRAVTFNAGQACGTATRWLIQDTVYDEFVDRARERMADVRVGYWSDPSTEMGPLVSETQRRRVLAYVEAARAEGAQGLMAGGPAEVPGVDGGFYVRPAMLSGGPDNVAAREEIFGPVPYLMAFSTEAEAIELVNQSPYGLANSVWSADIERAERVAESLVAGTGWINAHNIFVHGIPYAGVNLSGFGGGVLSPDTLFDYLHEQAIVRQT